MRCKSGGQSRGQKARAQDFTKIARGHAVNATYSPATGPKRDDFHSVRVVNSQSAFKAIGDAQQYVQCVYDRAEMMFGIFLHSISAFLSQHHGCTDASGARQPRVCEVAHILVHDAVSGTVRLGSATRQHSRQVQKNDMTRQSVRKLRRKWVGGVDRPELRFEKCFFFQPIRMIAAIGPQLSFSHVPHKATRSGSIIFLARASYSALRALLPLDFHASCPLHTQTMRCGRRL
jgi:hypothetical protein